MSDEATFTEINDRELMLEIGKDFLSWWELFGKIQDVYGQWIGPTANYLQQQIYEVWLYCYINDLPCRIIILKPRQKGSSTISTGLLYHTLSSRTANGAVIGGEYKQGAVLWRKLQGYEEHDEFQWKEGKGHIDEEKGKWPNGSYLGLATARNKFAGVASTNQFLLITELAKWAAEGVANASHVLSEILKTVHDVKGTTVIIESTAYGANGPYYEHWQSAHTFEEFKVRRSGYVKIFAPWFAFDDSRISPAWPKALRDEQIWKLKIDPKEIDDYVKTWKLDDEQLSWMLFAIEDKCEKDFDIFKQDYPSDEETAFLKSGRCRFNGAGVKHLKSLIRDPEYGVLEIDDNRVSWRVTDKQEAMFYCYENPRPGMEYLGICDPAKGANRTSGKDPDRHSVGILRKGYHDREGRWHRPKLVARIRAPIRWDIDVVAEQFWRLLLYYGNTGGCAALVEENMDAGIIENLLARGANVLTRKVFNHSEQKETELLGWFTNEKTRDYAIQALARAVREFDTEGDGIDIEDEHAVGEIESFIIGPGGRPEAAQGCHDDDVLMLAIGLYNIDRATMLHKVERTRRYRVEGEDDHEPGNGL
jgi:hypothetical protein